MKNNITTYKTNIERDLLLQVILHMRKHQLSAGKAQELAQEFLPTLKSATTIEELLEELSKLAKKYKEADTVFVKYANDFEKTVVKERLKAMSQLIANNEIDMALNIAKGGEA